MFKTFPEKYKYEIANVCLGISSSWSGSSDPMSDEELEESVEWLQKRLDYWDDPLSFKFAPIDLAFKNLIETTLVVHKECKKEELKRRMTRNK